MILPFGAVVCRTRFGRSGCIYHRLFGLLLTISVLLNIHACIARAGSDFGHFSCYHHTFHWALTMCHATFGTFQHIHTHAFTPIATLAIHLPPSPMPEYLFVHSVFLADTVLPPTCSHLRSPPPHPPHIPPCATLNRLDAYWLGHRTAPAAPPRAVAYTARRLCARGFLSSPTLLWLRARALDGARAGAPAHCAHTATTYSPAVGASFAGLARYAFLVGDANGSQLLRTRHARTACSHHTAAPTPHRYTRCPTYTLPPTPPPHHTRCLRTGGACHSLLLRACAPTPRALRVCALILLGSALGLPTRSNATAFPRSSTAFYAYTLPLPHILHAPVQFPFLPLQ